jgi:hypothetical protein
LRACQWIVAKHANMAERIDDILQPYLDAHPPHHESTERWPIQGEMRVRLSLADTLPPPHVSSSILSIVLDADQRVLYLWPTDRSGSIHQALIGAPKNYHRAHRDTELTEAGSDALTFLCVLCASVCSVVAFP